MDATRELLRVFITCGPANGAISTRRWGVECESLGLVASDCRSRALALALQSAAGRPSLREELLQADPPLPARVDFLRYWRAMERLMSQRDKVPRLDLDGSPFGRFEPSTQLVGEMRKFRDSVLALAQETKGDMLPVPLLEDVLQRQKAGSQDPAYWDEVGAHLPDAGDLPLVEVAEAIFLWLSEYDCATPRATPLRTPASAARARTPLGPADTNAQAGTPKQSWTPRWRGFDSPWRKVLTGLETEVKSLRTEVLERDGLLQGLRDDCEELSSAISALPEPAAATPNTKLGWRRARYHASRVRGADAAEQVDSLVAQLRDLEVAAAARERAFEEERCASAQQQDQVRRLSARLAEQQQELEHKQTELASLRASSASPTTPWQSDALAGGSPASPRDARHSRTPELGEGLGEQSRTPELPPGGWSPRRRSGPARSSHPVIEIHARARAERRKEKRRKSAPAAASLESRLEEAVLECAVQ